MGAERLVQRAVEIRKGLKALKEKLKFRVPVAVGFRTTVDTTEIENLIKKIEALDIANLLLQKLVKTIEEELTKAITTAQWSAYDGSTVDIVDTGALLDSQKVYIANNSIVVEYGVSYAGLVHFGGYIIPYQNPYAERVFLPARPWTTILRDGTIDFQGIVESELIKILKNKL